MKRAFRKTGLTIVNYTTMLPLVVFLLFTNQNKELNRLVSILKTGTAEIN